MTEKQQRIVLSIIDFLNQCVEDGTVKADNKERLEAATRFFGETFGVNPSDEAQVSRLSIKPATLPSIFDAFLKTREKVGTSAAPAASSSSQPKSISVEDKAKAEKLKESGNSLLSRKQYDQAIESYTQAIALDSTDPIYYSNRAAAYSSNGDHRSAVSDAEQAISLNPKFAKAYGRLGCAQYYLSDFRAAADAFERGLKFAPDDIGLKSGLERSNARITADDGPPPVTSNNLTGMGGGAGPGMASMMQNPQFMAMAQQVIANGRFEELMQNPTIVNMINRVQSGGGMPDMAELMSDPTLRDLTQRFGGGGA